ncbi:hypothetical protein GUITHDRAFT_108542 [Guillardia theta CCMP2712]|uniref:Uncharacterized protein n=1 Tax=Guillardia theta (strain CCMP2712) TaxID=905079 RepID=L1JAV9_GUITC|nr:hypothetical protein GUITHDRAFT_108542 [Guillardia theta CCMP2712]EKX45666.1 hypothetical protein GUITHDRAFT_108542 [Guillardia theta CCMP2712]|eukprot:XP_005832646.1 hypothetical protein GUITHDRAFT_108542 [Guillardia theta CCMP2712]
MPSHPHGRKMKGEIHIPGIRDRGSEQYEGLMADVTLVHPYIGSSADLTKWGEVNLDALHVAASEKIRKHRAAYAMTTPPRAFIPLAISTDGTLHPDTLRFICEEDYLERYRVPVSSLPPSAAPGGPPGNAGSLSAAALSPSAAARFVAAADVSTDSGQSAASGYRV